MDIRNENSQSNESNKQGLPKKLSRRKMLSALGVTGAAILASGISSDRSLFAGSSVHNSTYGNPNHPDPSRFRLTTIAELRGTTNPDADSIYYVTDAGQEGPFFYEASDTVSPDNTGLVLVSVSGARFKRVHQGEINIAWYGAVGNGATDSTAAIQAAIDTGLPIMMPAGTFMITNTLRVKSNGQVIRGSGRFVTILRNSANANPLLHFGDNLDPKATGYALSCAARDFTVEGNALSSEGVAFLGPQDDVATWGGASRACLLEGVRVSGIGSGPALRVSAWTPTVMGCEFWNSKKGIKIGQQVYSGRFIANYISGHAEEGIYCDVPASKASAILFSGNVVQWCGSPVGMIVLSGGGALTFHNTYAEVANAGCNAVWKLSNTSTNVTIDGVHFSSGTGEHAIDVIATDIKHCTIRNIQIFGNVRRGVYITGTLPITTIDSVRQPSGTSGVALIDDQSVRKQTFINNAPMGIEMGSAKIKSLTSTNAITIADTATGQTQWFVKDGYAYFGSGTTAPNIGASGSYLSVRQGTNEGFIQAAGVLLGASNIGIRYGTGSPEGVVTAPVGSFYARSDGGPGTTLYVKESGTGNTGWAAK